MKKTLAILAAMAALAFYAQPISAYNGGGGGDDDGGEDSGRRMLRGLAETETSPETQRQPVTDGTPEMLDSSEWYGNRYDRRHDRRDYRRYDRRHDSRYYRRGWW